MKSQNPFAPLDDVKIASSGEPNPASDGGVDLTSTAAKVAPAKKTAPAADQGAPTPAPEIRVEQTAPTPEIHVEQTRDPVPETAHDVTPGKPGWFASLVGGFVLAVLKVLTPVVEFFQGLVHGLLAPVRWVRENPKSAFVGALAVALLAGGSEYQASRRVETVSMKAPAGVEGSPWRKLWFGLDRHKTIHVETRGGRVDGCCLSDSQGRVYQPGESGKWSLIE